MQRCATCRFFGAPRPLLLIDYESDDYEELTSEHHFCARIIHGNAAPREHDPRKLVAEPAVVTVKLDGQDVLGTVEMREVEVKI